jgi:hypothetical protein
MATTSATRWPMHICRSACKLMNDGGLTLTAPWLCSTVGNDVTTDLALRPFDGVIVITRRWLHDFGNFALTGPSGKFSNA